MTQPTTTLTNPKLADSGDNALNKEARGVSRMVRLVVLLVAASAFQAAHAEILDVYRSTYSKQPITVDTNTIQRSGNLLRYRSVYPSYVGGQPGVIEDVLANCAERTRGLWTDGAMYSVYPDTRNGSEVEAVCSYSERAGLLPPELARARPKPAQAITTADATPPAPGPTTPSPTPTTPRTHGGEGGVSATGSGFFVNSHQVVTNFHVVEGCSNFRVRKDGSSFNATLVATAARNDLALLDVTGIAPSVPGVRAGAALGEDIMIAGHPLSGVLSEDLIVTSGQVNSLAGLGNDPTLLQISAPVQTGNSGGPVVDRSGNIVGVVVSKVNVLKLASLTGDMAQNINFAIKPEMLRIFLNANRVNYRTATSGKRFDGAELAEKARGFTVQVACLK